MAAGKSDGSEERRRLEEAREASVPWRKWGPYLSERQWGTVREDRSPDGDAWNSFTHEQARHRAYRWGEDGLGGICDDGQRLCFALALWNGRDPFLKERLFGLANGEGNHGEDVKEYYYYLDSTPTHSYMKFLYKYPQREFPYGALVEENRKRTRRDFEYELIDTGVFEGDRYFDVFVEYAKAGPEDLLVRVTAHNRGPEAAVLHLLPTLWFRNTWSAGGGGPKPSLRGEGNGVVLAAHPELGEVRLHCDGGPELLFTENEDDAARLGGAAGASPFSKGAFHELVVAGRRDAVNPARAGTKSAALYRAEVPAGGAWTVRLRLSPPSRTPPFGDFDTILERRIGEADGFFRSIAAPSLGEDERRVQRQALAGMLWSKQWYHYDLDRWLRERRAHPLLDPPRPGVRNADWSHMLNADVISMPDKWEYPWYAAWDLAFHTVPLGMVDPDFAKGQLLLMLDSRYSHPNGQIPAYEWNFSDVNPPVHAWAALRLYEAEAAAGRPDPAFLERAFRGLLLNFNWWVNRKDPAGRGVFGGGFLGLDNIGVFDRSAQLPTGGTLEQADGTAWMAFYSQCMLEMALVLADHDERYEDDAFRFVRHFLVISYAMDRLGEHPDEMWDEQDGFHYDLLRLPDGQGMRLKVRSMVGLLPLCASTVFAPGFADRHPGLMERIARLRRTLPEVVCHVAPTDEGFTGHRGRRLLSVLDRRKLERVLAVMLDEDEFLGKAGIRSLSRFHLEHPFTFRAGRQEYSVKYVPAESDTGVFGGNSNWRGPVWMPVNLLIVRALLNLHCFYGDEFKVRCPSRTGPLMNLFEAAREIARRMASPFLRGPDGRRPVFGGAAKFQEDPHWRDHLLFYEYFHGDDGAGLGASHQTGWTGVVAPLMDWFARTDAKTLLEAGPFAPAARTPAGGGRPRKR